MIEEDAGPIAVLKTENGPADPVTGCDRRITGTSSPAQVNNDGEPWPYGAFKYPRSIGGNKFVASYTLPAATESDARLRALHVHARPDRRRHAGGSGDVHARQPDVPLQRPEHERVRRPAAGAAPEAAGHRVDARSQRRLRRVPGAGRVQPRHERRPGAPAARRGPDRQHRGASPRARRRPGEMNDFSANEFEKRALIGFAPVYSDGSFRIKVPANTPISFATLDDRRPRLRREAHAPRSCGPARNSTSASAATRTVQRRRTGADEPGPDGASHQVPTDLDIPASQFADHQLRVEHRSDRRRQVRELPPADVRTAPRLRRQPRPDRRARHRRWKAGSSRAATSTSRARSMSMHGTTWSCRRFPRRSRLIDYVLGLGSQSGHRARIRAGADSLTAGESRLFNYWVLLGAQYK